VLVDLTHGNGENRSSTPPDAESQGYWFWDQKRCQVWSPDGQIRCFCLPLLCRRIPATIAGPAPSKDSGIRASPVVEVATSGSQLYRTVKKALGKRERTQFSDVRFDPDDSKRLLVDYYYAIDDRNLWKSEMGSEVYRQGDNGEWRVMNGPSGLRGAGTPIELKVLQGLNDPPKLVAIDKNDRCDESRSRPKSAVSRDSPGESLSLSLEGQDWTALGRGAGDCRRTMFHGRRYPSYFANARIQ